VLHAYVTVSDRRHYSVDYLRVFAVHVRICSMCRECEDMAMRS
jgi:hypothetical protein